MCRLVYKILILILQFKITRIYLSFHQYICYLYINFYNTAFYSCLQCNFYSFSQNSVKFHLIKVNFKIYIFFSRRLQFYSIIFRGNNGIIGINTLWYFFSVLVTRSFFQIETWVFNSSWNQYIKHSIISYHAKVEN